MSLRPLFLVLFSSAALLLASVAGGQQDGKQDITLVDGTILRSAKIILIANEKVSIVHDQGMSTVDADAVPLDLLARAHDRLSRVEAERQQHAARIEKRDSAQLRGAAGELRTVPLPEPVTRVSSRMTLRATGAESPTRSPEHACIVVRHSGGTGTGFILRQPDGFVLVSNQHVIDGAGPYAFELPGAKALGPSGGFLAVDRDIAILDLQEPTVPHYLEMEPDVDQVSLGEAVIVYGNSSGQGVRVAHAKLVAKSNVNIEVSGGIVKGNSGGPIIRAKTGRVVGVSTFVRIRNAPRNITELIEAAALPRIQFYGVRIDTLRKTAAFDLARFAVESANLDADERRMNEAMELFAVVLTRRSKRVSASFQKMAREAAPPVRQLVVLSNTNPPLFRQRLDQLLAQISPASSYIHAEKREQLVRIRDLLIKAFPDYLPRGH